MMRTIKLIWDFFRLWILWGDRKEAWQDAKLKNDPEFQKEMEKFDVGDCCPNCGERENIHTNFDWSKKDRPVENYLCNECGTYFKTKEI